MKPTITNEGREIEKCIIEFLMSMNLKPKRARFLKVLEFIEAMQKFPSILELKVPNEEEVADLERVLTTEVLEEEATPPEVSCLTE